MRRSTVIALAFFSVLDAMALYVAYVNVTAKHAAVPLFAEAPPVLWKGFDGSAHTLKDMSGHVVVLHFWASWCPPCREEFPKMIKAAIDNPDVMFLTVSSDSDKDSAMQFIKMAPDVSGLKSPPNMLYAWDPSKAITYDQFLTALYPETIFIDPSGHMRRKYPVAVDWESKDVHDFIQELKQKK